MGTQRVEKDSKVEAKVRTKIPKVAILTGIIIKEVMGPALPS